MSLHLANLSSRVRKNELERVFRGFGRCTVQVKDGYGFAVYDFREDAEKALRTLKGRKICGQSVYLSWSNKQPKPMQRFARATRPHDKKFGRNSDRGGDFRGRNFSSSHGGYSASDKHLQDKGRESYHSADDDRENFHTIDPMEGVLKESGYVEVEYNQTDNGRWGEQDDHLHIDSDFDGQMGVDHYNPDFDKGGEEYENQRLECSDNSQPAGTSPDKKRRLHSDSNRGKQTCFKCGTPGHSMRDCPLREKNAYQSDHNCDEKAKIEVVRADSRPGGRLQSSSRHSRLTRRSDNDKRQSQSGKVDIIGRRSPVENESRRDKREDNNYRKRRERDDHVLEARDDKKSRHLALSHRHSGYTSPELVTLSRSKRPLVGTSSHSRSASPIPRSISASSRSNSRAHSPSAKSLKFKSTSSSRSLSSSLSLSLGRSLPASPNKTHIDLNGFSERALSPPSKEIPNNFGQHFEPEVREENMSIANRAERSLSENADNVSSYQLMEVPINSKQHKHDSQTSNYTNYTEMNLNNIVEDDQIIQNQETVPSEQHGLDSEPAQKSASPQTDVHRLSENISSSGKVIGEMTLGQFLNDGGSNSTTPQLFCEFEAPFSSLLENDDEETSDIKIAAQNSRTEENTYAIKTRNRFEPASSPLFSSSHLSMSVEEVSRVLKHYGLKHPDDNKQHLDVGDYFGSSRLWPWEMIYYRRLKKGPISVENYARRVVQNKEFNITDKYIRSSSGWGELIEEHDKKELNLF